MYSNHANNDRGVDGHDLYSIGPPVGKETPLQPEDLEPALAAVDAFYKAILEFAPLKHDAGEPICGPCAGYDDGKLQFVIDFPELEKADTVALLETIIESRWIVQSGQCASCGVGVVETFDALDMDDEGRLICIRCAESNYEDWCRDHDDDGEWLG